MMKQLTGGDTCSVLSAGIVWLTFVPLLLLQTQIAAQDNNSMDVAAQSERAGDATLYTLQFTLRDSLPVDAAFEVTFPSGFDLSDTRIADSDAVNGGFRIEVSTLTLTIFRKGEGESVSPGEEVDLKFAMVRNPDNAGDYDITLQIRQSQPETSPVIYAGTVALTQSQ